MSVDLTEYEGVTNKKVTVQYNGEPDESGQRELLESDGTLMAVQPTIGVMFRPKGSNRGILIDKENLVAIVTPPPAAKKIKQKNFKLVTEEDVKQHLADRHAYPLSWVNDATPEQALEAHASIDHAELGHKHSAVKAEGAESSNEVPVPA